MRELPRHALANRRAAAVLALAVLCGVPPALRAVVPDKAAQLTALTFVAMLVAAYSLGAHAPPRHGLAAVGLLAVAQQIGLGTESFPNVEVLLTSLAPWLVGHEVRKRRLIVEALAEREAELRAGEEELARLAVQGEQARIARELHDIVSHHLAVVVIQATAGRLEPAGTALVVQRLATIAGAASEALVDLDNLVDVMADRPPRDHLDQLCARARASGLVLELAPLPAGIELPAELDELVHRIVQEALTNVLKHAPGATTSVRVELAGDTLAVEVVDGGAAARGQPAATGASMGLHGMRERVHAVAGQLVAGPLPDGGWQVRATVPLTRPP